MIVVSTAMALIAPDIRRLERRAWPIACLGTGIHTPRGSLLDDLDSMEDAGGLLRGHDMPSRVGRSPARPLESSPGMGRATLGTWIGQRSLPARG